MPCSAACAAVRLRITKPSARSARMPTSLSGSDAAQLRLRVLGEVDHHVLGLRARAVDLEVAADARALVRHAVAVLGRRVRHRLVRERPALEVDQVLVVRAVHLVAEGRRARAVVRLLLVLGALRVVRRLRARLRLDVLARHDRPRGRCCATLDRRLDALELAAPRERAVLPLQPPRVARRELLRPCEGRSTVPFFRAELIDRIARFSEPRWHTTRVSPAAFVLQRRGERARLRHLAAAAGLTLVSGAGSGQYELRSTWP